MDKNRKIIIQKDESNERRIAANWGLVKRSVKLSDVVDPLIENGVITPDQWMDIKSRQVGEPEKMEEFLYILLKQKSEAFDIFKRVLRTSGFQHVADCLGGMSNNTCYDQVKTDFQKATGHIQASKENDVSNTAKTKNSADRGDQSSASSSKSADTVRQKDLDQMKQEIKDELRNIRENLESERKQDRDQLLMLQREHKHLQNDFEKLRRQKCELSERLGDLLKVVDGLKNKLEEKEREYLELKKINNGLKDDLMRQNIDHTKVNNIRDKEKDEIEKKLQKKTDEYKLLQGMIETLKSDHEERLSRLRAINKEKVRLEGEHKKVLAEKKEVEAKFQARDREAKEAQTKHDNEVSDLRNNIETKMMRIEELEKDKSELVQRLSLTEKENEGLKQENKRLEDGLRKTEGDKELLSTRLRQYDLQKYTVPNFSSVVRHQTFTTQGRPPPKPQWRRGNQGK